MGFHDERHEELRPSRDSPLQGQPGHQRVRRLAGTGGGVNYPTYTNCECFYVEDYYNYGRAHMCVIIINIFLLVSAILWGFGEMGDFS